MGYGSGVKGYKFWCSDSKKIILSKDVIFDECVMIITRKVFFFDDSGKLKGIKQKVEFEISEFLQSS